MTAATPYLPSIKIGVFNEELEIDKSLHLLGPGEGRGECPIRNQCLSEGNWSDAWCSKLLLSLDEEAWLRGPMVVTGAATDEVTVQGFLFDSSSPSGSPIGSAVTALSVIDTGARISVSDHVFTGFAANEALRETTDTRAVPGPRRRLKARICPCPRTSAAIGLKRTS